MKEPTCGDCGQELTLVRPGKHQCDNPNCVQNNSKPESVPSCVDDLEDLEMMAVRWVNDGTSGYPDPDDKAGVWMFNKLKEAFIAGAIYARNCKISTDILTKH